MVNGEEIKIEDADGGDDQLEANPLASGSSDQSIDSKVLEEYEQVVDMLEMRQRMIQKFLQSKCSDERHEILRKLKESFQNDVLDQV